MPYLARQLDLAQAHGLTARVIELSLLEAQAWRADGDRERAWTALERALGLAQPEGFLRIFDQGTAFTHLLAEAAQRGICREYIGHILAAIGTQEAAGVGRENEPGRQNAAGRLRGSGPGYIEPLSGRELEVLRLMARGASNQAIAQQLVITVGTVKSHINHILGKLSAHNRTEAVAQARGLGLLDI
jgi:LuxR family maltose regulon positive regulatory protein